MYPKQAYMKYFHLILLIAFSSVINAETTSFSASDKRLVAQGPIDDTQYIASGILGTIPGFGLGHAIQGRWKDKGWIFSAGETLGAGLMIASGSSCMGGSMMEDNNDRNGSGGNIALANPGMVTYLGFKVWEIVDIWTYPPAHNKRLKEIESAKSIQTSIFMAPILDQRSSGLALHLKF